MSTEDEVAALRAEVRELREEVARLATSQDAPGRTEIGTHPAYEPVWPEPASL